MTQQFDPAEEFEKWEAMPGYVWIKQRDDLGKEMTPGGLELPGKRGRDVLQIGEVIDSGVYTSKAGKPIYAAGWITKGALVQYKCAMFQLRSVGGEITHYVYSEDVVCCLSRGYFDPVPYAHVMRPPSRSLAAPGHVLYTEAEATKLARSKGGVWMPDCPEKNGWCSNEGKVVGVGPHVHPKSGETLPHGLEKDMKFKMLNHDSKECRYATKDGKPAEMRACRISDVGLRERRK